MTARYLLPIASSLVALLTWPSSYLLFYLTVRPIHSSFLSPSALLLDFNSDLSHSEYITPHLGLVSLRLFDSLDREKRNPEREANGNEKKILELKIFSFSLFYSS